MNILQDAFRVIDILTVNTDQSRMIPTEPSAAMTTLISMVDELNTTIRTMRHAGNLNAELSQRMLDDQRLNHQRMITEMQRQQQQELQQAAKARAAETQTFQQTLHHEHSSAGHRIHVVEEENEYLQNQLANACARIERLEE